MTEVQIKFNPIINHITCREHFFSFGFILLHTQIHLHVNAQKKIQKFVTLLINLIQIPYK